VAVASLLRNRKAISIITAPRKGAYALTKSFLEKRLLAIPKSEPEIIMVAPLPIRSSFSFTDL